MFEEIVDFLCEREGTPINEVISLGQIRGNLANPSIAPTPLDYSTEAWLERISLWGALNIGYKDTGFGGNKKITKGQFLKKLNDPQLLKLFGKWQKPEVLAVNKVRITRQYTGLDGKSTVSYTHLRAHET